MPAEERYKSTIPRGRYYVDGVADPKMSKEAIQGVLCQKVRVIPRTIHTVPVYIERRILVTPLPRRRVDRHPSDTTHDSARKGERP